MHEYFVSMGSFPIDRSRHLLTKKWKKTSMLNIQSIRSRHRGQHTCHPWEWATALKSELPARMQRLVPRMRAGRCMVLKRVTPCSVPVSTPFPVTSACSNFHYLPASSCQQAWPVPLQGSVDFGFHPTKHQLLQRIQSNTCVCPWPCITKLTWLRSGERRWGEGRDGLRII